MTLLTVVTVVKDDPDGLAATLTSVPLSPEIQIVVIDSSADDTAMQTSIGSRVVTYHWAAPEGVYPAMNIGVAHATGDYVFFLNAGDTLIDGQLSLVLDVLKRQAPTLPAITPPLWPSSRPYSPIPMLPIPLAVWPLPANCTTSPTTTGDFPANLCLQLQHFTRNTFDFVMVTTIKW